jgi:biopolymer transport protein ExbD
MQNQEFESKLTLGERSQDRAHSTEHLEDDDPITEINVAPLVDVALVLVIIFMAVSPFVMQTGLQVSSSSASSETGKAAIGENIQIALKANGAIAVNGQAIEADDLMAVLKKKLPETKDKLVSVVADDNNAVGQVVRILDIAKQSGAKKVAILNDKGN